ELIPAEMVPGGPCPADGDQQRRGRPCLALATAGVFGTNERRCGPNPPSGEQTRLQPRMESKVYGDAEAGRDGEPCQRTIRRPRRRRLEGRGVVFQQLFTQAKRPSGSLATVYSKPVAHAKSRRRVAVLPTWRNNTGALIPIPRKALASE